QNTISDSTFTTRATDSCSGAVTSYVEGIYLGGSSQNTFRNLTLDSYVSSGGRAYVYGIYNGGLSSYNLFDQIRVNRSNGTSVYGSTYISAASGIHILAPYNSVTNSNAALGATGVYVGSSGITVSGSNFTNEYYGVFVNAGSNNVTNTLSYNNSYGFYVANPLYATSNIFLNDTALENYYYDFKFDLSSQNVCTNQIINSTGSGMRPVVYYNSPFNASNIDASEMLLCGVSGSGMSNVTVHGSDAYYNNGVEIYWAQNSAFANISSLGNLKGVELYNSDYNSFDGVKVSNASGFYDANSPPYHGYSRMLNVTLSDYNNFSNVYVFF
ncbi:MAG TPA: hypothetical protein PLO51_00660, partial [Candidatus Micrarchaeota archaeon]|nr:hypothetical protein [Candidatus Micrarchaeota archaeon]